MKIIIYYGGRGLIDDPTMYMLDKIQLVLDELRVQVERINLFEQKNQITTLPQTLNEADGIILATTVEWYGIGGYMQQFLDACWLFGNKEKISSIYMQPIVMSTTYGEKEGLATLTTAWEVLGGMLGDGISGYVDNILEFEMNEEYSSIIEKKTENFYRTISQKMVNMPSSNRAMQHSVRKTHRIELTPKESEQLSKFASDDTYVKKQKEDIEELSNLFKGMMEKDEKAMEVSELERIWRECFVPQEDFRASYQFEIDDKKKLFHVNVRNQNMDCYYGELEEADITAKLSTTVMYDIIYGRMSVQRAFMTGEMISKGDFKILRMLDQIFNFGK